MRLRWRVGLMGAMVTCVVLQIVLSNWQFRFLEHDTTTLFRMTRLYVAGDPTKPISDPKLRNTAHCKHVDCIHAVIFSDRIKASEIVINSISMNTDSFLVVHMFVPDSRASSVRDGSLSIMARLPKLTIVVYPFDATVVQPLENLGYNPVWLWDEYGSSMKGDLAAWRRNWTVSPAQWDYDPKHYTKYNLARFYMAEFPQFRDLDRIIFIDDDITIQRDLREIWDEPFEPGRVIKAGCRIWRWDRSCNRWTLAERGEPMAHFPFFGFGPLDHARSEQNATCTAPGQRECMSPGFLDRLAAIHDEISRANAPRVASPGVAVPSRRLDLRNHSTWNFGFVLFDLKQWREYRMTEVYGDWLRANYKWHLFPEYTLAFGLGLAFLAYYDRVQCFGHNWLIAESLGFVPPHDLHSAGLDGHGLHNYAVLHFAGEAKPWHPNSAISEHLPLVLKFAPREVQRLFDDPRALERKAPRVVFLVTDWTVDAREFKALLNELPGVCAGKTPKGSETIPDDFLNPRWLEMHGYGAKVACQWRTGCYWDFFSRALAVIRRDPNACTDRPRNRTLSQQQSLAAAELEPHVNSLCQWIRRLRDVYGSHDKNSHQRLDETNNLGLPDAFTPQRQSVQEMGIPTPTELLAEFVRAAAKGDEIMDGGAWIPCRCPRGTHTVVFRVMQEWIEHDQSLIHSQETAAYRDDLRWFLKPPTAYDEGAEERYPDLIEAIRRVNGTVLWYETDLRRAVSVHLQQTNEASSEQFLSNSTNETDTGMARHASLGRKDNKGVELDVADLVLTLTAHKRHIERQTQALLSQGIHVKTISHEWCVTNAPSCLQQAARILGYPLAEQASNLESRYENSKDINYGEDAELMYKALEFAASRPWLSEMVTNWKSVAAVLLRKGLVPDNFHASPSQVHPSSKSSMSGQNEEVVAPYSCYVHQHNGGSGPFRYVAGVDDESSCITEHSGFWSACALGEPLSKARKGSYLPVRANVKLPRFVMLSSARSGSTFLVDVLNAHPEVYSMDELMLPYWHSVVRQAYPGITERYPDVNADLLEFPWAHVRKHLHDALFGTLPAFRWSARKCRSARMLGFKWFDNQGLGRNREAVVQEFARLNISVLFLHRDNHLSRLLSRDKALKYKVWHSSDLARLSKSDRQAFKSGLFELDTDHLLTTLLKWHKEILSMRNICKRAPRCLDISYSQLTSPETQPEIIRALFEFLGVSPMEHVSMKGVRKRLSGGARKLTIERFSNADEIRFLLEGTIFEPLLSMK